MKKSSPLQYLSEVCPDKSDSQLVVALESSDGDMQEAIHLLLDGDQSNHIDPGNLLQHSGTSGAGESSMELVVPANEPVDVILKSHIKEVINDENDTSLDVSRDDVWHACLGFYKVAIKHPERLRNNFYVQFVETGEKGIDGGALKVEFFSICLKEAKERLFEGDKELIPRRGIGSKSIQFEVVGALIAHSVLQCGPGFPVLAEWVIDYLIEQDTNTLMISKDYIVKSESTATLIELIEKLDVVESKVALDALLEEDPNHESFWQVINSTEWSSTEAVTMENKQFLVQELIFTELVRRRKDQLIALGKGLQCLGFLDLLKRHKKVAQHVLLYKQEKLTAERFLSFLGSTPEGHAERQALQWFREYIWTAEEKDPEFSEGKLNTLLKFSTGLWAIPPCSSKMAISVKFLEDDEDYSLPKASACACIIMLPTVFSSKTKFFEQMDIALKFGHAGFAEY